MAAVFKKRLCPWKGLIGIRCNDCRWSRETNKRLNNRRSYRMNKQHRAVTKGTNNKNTQVKTSAS